MRVLCRCCDAIPSPNEVVFSCYVVCLHVLFILISRRSVAQGLAISQMWAPPRSTCIVNLFRSLPPTVHCILFSDVRLASHPMLAEEQLLLHRRPRDVPKMINNLQPLHRSLGFDWLPVLDGFDTPEF